MKEEKREDMVEEVKDDFDDIKEMQKTQELKKIELEKEEKKEEKKKEVKEKKNHPNFVAFLIVVLMILFTLMGYCCGVVSTKYSHNGKSDSSQSSDKTKNDSEKNPYAVIVEKNRIGLLDSNFKLIWSTSLNEYIPYSSTALIDDYLYYTDKNDLYRLNVKTKVIENLNYTLKDNWTLDGEGNILVYTSLFDVHVLDLKTMKDFLLSIKQNSLLFYHNQVIYYTREDDNTLCGYNIETQEEFEIEKNARILSTNKKTFIYTSDDKNYYLYDIKKNNKTLVFNNEKLSNHYISFYQNSEVYLVIDDTLYTVNNNKKNELYKFSLKSDESISNVFTIGKNKYLVKKYIDNGPPCHSDICGPTGESQFYLLDLDKNEWNLIDTQGWNFDNSSIVLLDK